MKGFIKSEAKLLAKHSTIYAIGNLANRVVSFLLLPIYTRFLTTRDYGIKELIGLTTDVVGILLAMTIASAIQRFYFEYENEKDRHEVISSAIILLSGLGVIAVYFLFILSNEIANLILDDPELGYYFKISFVSMLFQTVNAVGFNYLRFNHLSKTFITLSFGKLAVVIFLNIYFICFLKIGVLGILLSTLVSSLIVFIVLDVPLIIKVKLRFSFYKIKEMAIFGFPLMLSQIGAFVVHLSDRFFIKTYLSVGDAGLYSLGYRFGTMPGTFVSVPFNQIWGPRRFEMFKEPNSEQVFGRIFTYYLTLLVFCGLGVSVLAKDVLMVIADNSFWSAYKIVPIIILANIIYNLSPHLSMGLVIAKKTRWMAIIDGSNGILVLVFNYFFIRSYGIYGAAYVTLIAFIYKILMIYYFSRKYHNIFFEIKRVIKILASAIAIFFIVKLTEIDHIYLNITKNVIFLFCYPILLYLFKFLYFEEKEEIRVYLKKCFLLFMKLD